jgi:GTP cyclohydrolase IB
MNAPERIPLGDVQSLPDDRNLPIDAVGVRGLRYPIVIKSGEAVAPTIATLSMAVALPAIAKGTHMSRFVELLEAQSGPISLKRFRQLVAAMLERLDADSGEVELGFRWFARKTAPVSGIDSLLDYEVSWRGMRAQGKDSLWLTVAVPATSLCPCSKAISAYGAHNQRSNIRIETELAGEMAIEDLIAIAERSASCEVYGLLKRPDEKYVTERAYDNPKFVEDLVRDVALALNQEPRVGAYVVEAENFESIHNHSAFARIVRTSPVTGRAPSRREQGRHLQLL